MCSAHPHVTGAALYIVGALAQRTLIPCTPMAPRRLEHDPLVLPAGVDVLIDRRFPFVGGGRSLNPDYPEGQYRTAWCCHGWRAQQRNVNYDNVNKTVFGCPGYIFKADPDDGYHCGYKEYGAAESTYCMRSNLRAQIDGYRYVVGVLSVQSVNPTWDGITFLREPDKAFFEKRKRDARDRRRRDEPGDGSTSSGQTSPVKSTLSLDERTPASSLSKRDHSPNRDPGPSFPVKRVRREWPYLFLCL